MTFLRNDSSEKTSPISEGVVEIQINITLQIRYMGVRALTSKIKSHLEI
jgi:hypothetical protein